MTDKKTSPAIAVSALCLELIPVPVIFLLNQLGSFAAIALLPVLLAPFAGLLLGVFYISRGKEKTSRLGKIFALTAVILPLSLVGLIAVFFFGAMTGLIPLM